MRILIANHIDPAIRDRGDLRAWTQRVFWFASDGDVVVLCDEPDNGFLTYATGHTATAPADAYSASDHVGIPLTREEHDDHPPA